MTASSGHRPIIISRFMTSSSNIISVPGADALHPLFVQLVEVCAPRLLVTVPPPFPALECHNKLLPGLHNELDVRPVSHRVGDEVLVLEKLLPVQVCEFALFPGRVELGDDAVLTPAVLFMELLVILHEELRVLVGELTQARGRIKRRPLDAEFDVIGLEGDIEICVKIFRYAVRCIKSEQKKLRKQHRDYYTPQEIAKICDSYGYGFARGVYEAFTRQNEENQEYGLVLKVPKEVKDELEKIGPPKEFKKTPQPKTVGELDAAWRGIEDGRKFDPSNKLEEKKQEA